MTLFSIQIIVIPKGEEKNLLILTHSHEVSSLRSHMPNLNLKFVHVRFHPTKYLPATTEIDKNHFSLTIIKV